MLRISNFFFSAVSATFLSPGDAVNEKHGLCRNIHTRNAADPQKSRIKKSGFRQLQEAAISGPRVRSRPFATKLASRANCRWSTPRCLKPSAQTRVNPRESVSNALLCTAKAHYLVFLTSFWTTTFITAATVRCCGLF